MRARNVSALFTRPRVVVIGSYRTALGASDDTPIEALSRVAGVHPIDAAPTPAGLVRAIRQGAKALADGCEAVHLLDARLALPALVLRSRFGVPVSVTLTGNDAASKRARAGVGRLDHGFAHGGALGASKALRRLAVSTVPPIAPTAAEPSRRRLASLARLVRDATPGRLVVAAPWPADDEQVRWCRDAVVPLLHGNPLWLFIGAPGRRQARLMAGAIGLGGSFRAHIGRIDADVIAAAARCADVFAVAGAPARAHAGASELLLALVATKVPVVAGGGIDSAVLEDERDAFIASPGDASGFVATVNKLLALPAVQRHYLGEEFAEYAAGRYSWDAASSIYGERFAAMVGRPQIPAELRAA
jgi:glycosyltransferase involved in cell wall biosynthesis